jgi:hypothetical protein
MPWIESHQELKDHPKTKRLCRILGITLPEAIGHLHLMWWYCLDYAQDGDVSFDRFSVEDIAEMACWTRDAHVFVDALTRAGFLETRDERLLIHDWDDYAGKLIDRRERNAQAMRERRAAQEKPTKKRVRNTSRTRVDTCKATEQNTTEPNQLTDGFAAFFASYPRHDAKAMSERAWDKLTAEEQGRAMSALPKWKGCDQWQNVQYIPQASTYLNQRRFDDEPPPHSLSPSGYRSQAEINQLKRNPDGTPKWVG